MIEHVYPAVFTHEDDGSYSINFPDFESCYTSGETLEDAISMAKDALRLVLDDMEVKGLKAPVASDVYAVAHGENEIVMPISYI